MPTPKSKPSYWFEKLIMLISLFLFAAGATLIADGKKIYARQLEHSAQVDYKATLSPFSKKITDQ